jgi:hypothetical protein
MPFRSNGHVVTAAFRSRSPSGSEGLSRKRCDGALQLAALSVTVDHVPCPQPEGVWLVNSIVQPGGVGDEWPDRVAAVRRELSKHGPPRSPDGGPDFATVTLPAEERRQ